MKRLRAVLGEGAARGDRTLILCDNDGQIQRLEEIMGGRARLSADTQLAVGALERGFTLNDSVPRLRILTDHEIFLRSRRIRRRRRFRGSASLDSVAQLSPGDAVVHMDHGIGRFRGLDHVTIGGEEIESILIEYAGSEFLRVPIYRLDLLERWAGSTEEAEPPPVHRIGGKRWKNLRTRTEQAIRKVATELLELYARRRWPGATRSRPTRAGRRKWNRPSSTRTRAISDGWSKTSSGTWRRPLPWIGWSAGTSDTARLRSPFAPPSRRSRTASRSPSSPPPPFWSSSTRARSENGSPTIP